jgi:cellulose synthase/poly-beta-1,6-N-acetylglucosamine synthase-like glycosyltransferase
VIEDKIKNTLNLNYPKEKLEIIVFSDSSSDQTDDIVKMYEKDGIKLLRIEGRKGKTFCQNRAVEEVKGEIIVFSDANSMYKRDAVRKLVRNFADERIGCVSGELKYINSANKKDENSEGIYWKYEQIIKKLESKVSSLVGANGAIYAVRKKLYVPLEDFAISDFAEPLMIFEKGYRVIYEAEALAFEINDDTFKDSYSRRVRIVTRTFNNIIRSSEILELFNPIKYGWYSIQLVSHKLLRWFTGLFMFILLLLNIILAKESWVYATILILQLLFYLAALLGFLNQKFFPKKEGRLLNYIFYFCLSNIAMLNGIINAVLKNKIITWDTKR